MAKTGFKSVEEYIAAQPEAVRGVLELLRTIIRKALPGAEETISYNLPTYKMHGRAVIYFAGWKEHYSLYPIDGPVAAAFKEDFAPYDLSGRGTIRFPLSEPVPVKLIERIAKFRAKELAGLGKRKMAGSKETPDSRKRLRISENGKRAQGRGRAIS